LRQQRRTRMKPHDKTELGKVFKRILVAVDGSESSLRAAKVAVRLAKRNEAKLLVVSVIQRPAHPYMPTPSVVIPSVPMIGLQDYYTNASKTADEWLDNVLSLARSLRVNAKKSVLKDAPSIVKSITDYAASQKIDLIIVGRKGSGGFKRLLLGSVSNGVVNHAASSVLVVR
jgi:nucleotide-binding universal stress UspA family protein